MRNPQKIRAPRLSRSEIVERAERLTKTYAKSIDPALALLHTSFDAIYNEIIYPEYEIEIQEHVELGFDELGEKILGEYDPLSNVVSIDEVISEQSKDPRRAFTLWHEVGGHGVLQGDWLRKELARISGNGRIITTESSITDETVDILERQANLFAANAGVPLWLLEHRMSQVFGLTRPLRYVGPTRYCLEVGGTCRFNDVETFDDLCRLIAYYVKPSFGGISTECIGYQVAKTNWVVDETRMRTFPLRRTQRAASVPAPVCHSEMIGAALDYQAG